MAAMQTCVHSWLICNDEYLCVVPSLFPSFINPADCYNVHGGGYIRGVGTEGGGGGRSSIITIHQKVVTQLSPCMHGMIHMTFSPPPPLPPSSHPKSKYLKLVWFLILFLPFLTEQNNSVCGEWEGWLWWSDKVVGSRCWREWSKIWCKWYDL